MTFLHFEHNHELALFVVRIIVGSTFVMHGSQKVFGWFGGSGLAGFAHWLKSFHVPRLLAYASAFTELIGGFMVLLGWFAEIWALLLMINMSVAIILVHRRKGYFLPDGMEYALNLLLLCLAIFIGGAGSCCLV